MILLHIYNKDNMEQQYSNLLYKIKKQINKIIFSYNVNSIKYKNQFIYRNQLIKEKTLILKIYLL